MSRTPKTPAAAALLALALAGLTGLACDPAPVPDTPPAGGDPASEAAARPPAPVRDTALEAALRDIVAGLDGQVGVAVRHLQRQVHASVNGDHRFPLASVYKLPIAYAALQGGYLAPTDSLGVEAADRAPGETPFTPGTNAPVAHLVERSIAHSDNTASDVLLRAAGGAGEVRRRLGGAGIHEVRVDRTMVRVFADWRSGDRAAFLQGEQDTGTAEGMVEMLAAVHEGRELDPGARTLLLEAMGGAVTGPNRIRAGVPDAERVAHKTGTLGPLTHDVGIITLPAGRGDVAIAVLVRSNEPVAARERLTAALSRAVSDWFVSGAAPTIQTPAPEVP
jgi:beta-lactamase class A